MCAMTAEGEIEKCRVCLLLPLTFMNDSGIAVKKAVVNKKIIREDILLVTDDVHLAFGTMRIRSWGSDGGHNGLTSIIHHLGHNQFARMRLGIGLPPPAEELVDYVLGEFKSQEKKRLDDFIESANEGCVIWLTQGIHKAMNQFNQRKGYE